MNRFRIALVCSCAFTQWETPDFEDMVRILDRAMDRCMCFDHEITVYDEVKEKKYYLNKYDMENSIKKVLLYSS